MALMEPIVIAGSGIAGLSAAWRLQADSEVPFVLYEKSEHVGGYSRTMQYGDFRFDLGGHRFYTKKAHVERLVRDLLGEDRLTVDRLSRILLNGRFVHYPLSIVSTLRGLGLTGAARAVFDYGAMKVGSLFAAPGAEETFEQWALNRFGEYLYRIYFKGYTEKTWGIPCSELAADFAEQRIKGLSFREAVRDALLKRGEDDSLVRRFIYPRFGFGQIPDAMAGTVREPSRLLTGHEVAEVEHDGDRVTAVTTRDSAGNSGRQPCSGLLSSIPVNEIVHMLRPAAPQDVLDAADRLRYRSVVVLVLFLDVERVSPDHWIYVPSPDIGFCRLHEPKNWSAEMAPPDKTSLVVEYFCQEGDESWTREPADLAADATDDLVSMGLIRSEWVSGFTTVRLSRAYPLYDLGYRQHVDAVNRHLARFGNLHNIGRNASFVYTSSDHYIDMGLKAAQNAMGHGHDLSAIGREPGYAES